MALNTVNHSSKPQLSAYNTKETDQAENKANSHFKTSIKKATQSLVSFFLYFLVAKKTSQPEKNRFK